MTRVWIAVVLMALATPALAQERILAYDSEVAINVDGSLDVTEHITVRAEGRNIRRGIYRDFPTRYRDRHGNHVVVDVEVLGVERNGAAEPWFTERVSNGIRINTGNDDLLRVPAEYRFTLRYRTTRQLGFFESHDELYWNAIGTGWDFRIEAGSVEVRLPSPVPVAALGAEGYTGPQGAQGGAYEAEVPEPGVARYRLSAPLDTREGFTIVLTFPKGIVTAPTGAERLRWFLQDNGGVLVALGGLLALLLFVVREWRRVGRDPDPGPTIARYLPPDGHTPASLRYVRRMGYDMRCFSADVLSLAVAGQLRIHREKRRFSEQWRLERSGEADAATVTETARPLLLHLFPAGRKSLELKNTNASTVQKARNAHGDALKTALNPRYFKLNGGSTVVAALLMAASLIASVVVSGGAGIPVIVAVHGLMAVIVVVFARLVRAPTAEGRALLDEIEGLKLYLSVAEREELSILPGPGAPPVLDAARYEALLPYAVALEVEEAWTDKFTAAVGAAAAAAAATSMAWYSGSRGMSNLGDFSKALGSSLTSQISSASSPPGSSSGSGGGGSSGGGGGGGGGGGR
ncbi:MAG: DUF2207 domain-containing protein [Vicinamibacterales bacterium]|nr:DUF2207 domain-containing protein [Vicinamibacterales bacterium]